MKRKIFVFSAENYEQSEVDAIAVLATDQSEAFKIARKFFIEKQAEGGIVVDEINPDQDQVILVSRAIL